MNYYNELDPHAAQWLRNLIEAGAIPPGFVDTRSIEDVTPNELAAYTQCHFFAGIGGWVYALDLAGWPRDRPVWTGSCPCQPFSAAGKGAGFEDERHLWPAWQHLIAQCRPPVVFGEQVASKAVDDWIDLVHADMEGMGYAFGSVPFPAAGVGAPHIRDRNYWMGERPAHSAGAGRRSEWQDGDATNGLEAVPAGQAESGRCSTVGGSSWLADTNGGNTSAERQQRSGQQRFQPQDSGGLFGVGNAAGAASQRDARGISGTQAQIDRSRSVDGRGAFRLEHAGPGMGSELAGPTNGKWRNADWLGCRDGKWRPVEPGTFPLAHGVSGRVGLLRGYGNAIVPQAAAEFVIAYMQSTQRAALLDAA